MKPKVTVGMCARNAESTIVSSIESILSQDFPHELMEILFVNDGSEDKTLEIMQGFASKTDIMTRIFSNGWHGLGRARNTILKNARGDYVVWVDSDEIIENSFLKKQIHLIERNPRAGIVTAGLTIDPKENPVLLLDLLPPVVEYSTQDWLTAWKLPGTGGSTYRTEAARQVGGFNETIKGAGEDTDISRRMKQAGWLIIRGEARFYEKHGSLSSWKGLLKKYVYHGVQARQLYDQNYLSFSFYRSNPFASFVAGLIYAVRGYRITHLKMAILLPFQYPLKMTAWFYGFTKGYPIQ